MMNNTKEYRAPEIELVNVAEQDVIRTSGGFRGMDDSFIDDLNQNQDI